MTWCRPPNFYSLLRFHTEMDIELLIFFFVQIALILMQNGSASASSNNKIVFCLKPNFYKGDQCSSALTPSSPPPVIHDISKSIAIDVTKLELHLDQWIHIDVAPTPSAIASGSTLNIEYAMLQLTNGTNHFLGRIAEHLPCSHVDHPLYPGQMNELYRNPGPRDIEIFECPHVPSLSYGMNPTVAVLNFDPPVQAFYVNIKFTREEMHFIFNQNQTDSNLSLTTLIKDQSGVCYLHQITDLHGLSSSNPSVSPGDISLPLDCHSGDHAFSNKKGDKSPLLMTDNYKPHFSDVHFLPNSVEIRPRSRGKMPQFTKDAWNRKVHGYNYEKHFVDASGYLPGEGRVQKHSDLSAVRRPWVPLVFSDDHARAYQLEEPPVKFDADDEECEDKMRHRKPNNIKETIQSIYFNCNFIMGCIGEPINCLTEKNCRFLVAWGKEGDFVRFEVLAERNVFAAVGLSHDDKMGNDSVTECVRQVNDDEVYGYTSWNTRRNNTRMRSCEPMQDFIGDVTGDLALYCSWRRPVVTKVKGLTFDMNQPLYLLLASGTLTTHGVWGNLGMHEVNFVFPQPLVFNQYFGKSPFQLFVERSHGIAMIVAWMFIVPVSTFIVRYFKGTFVTVRIRGYTLWFLSHSILMTIVILFTWASTFFAFVLDTHWAIEKELIVNPHGILGIVLGSLTVFQVIFAFVTVKFPTKCSFRKLRINFIHGGLGHLLFFLGSKLIHIMLVWPKVGCVYTSKDVRDGVPCDSVGPLLVYIAVYVVTHIIMSYQVCFTDFLQGRESSRIYKIFVVDKPETDEVEEPGGPSRKITFAIFVPILAGFTIYMLCVTLLPGYFDCVAEEKMMPVERYAVGLITE